MKEPVGIHCQLAKPFAGVGRQRLARGIRCARAKYSERAAGSCDDEALFDTVHRRKRCWEKGSSIKTTSDHISCCIEDPLNEPRQTVQDGIDRSAFAYQALVKDALDFRNEGVVVRILDRAIEGDRENHSIGPGD